MRAYRVVTRVFMPVLALGALAVAFGSSSCAATPTPIPVRSFDRPQKVAFVCLDVNASTTHAIETAPEAACPPVAPNAIGTTLDFHYYALVTQLTRGELAVVDLTSGAIVDEDQSTPGANFIPVGANPTDVVVAPVACLDSPGFAYVASADPSSYALYAIDDHRLLGDSTGDPPAPPLQLTDLVACALPAPPVALAIVVSPANPASSNAGGDAGTGAGGTPAGGTDGGAACQPMNYTIAVLLKESAGQPAQVMMVDPAQLTHGTPPGLTLPPCQAVGFASGVASAGLTGPFSSNLAGATVLPGLSWPDGVPYADGGGASVLVAPSAGIPDAGTAASPDSGNAGAGGSLDSGTGGDLEAGAPAGFDADVDTEAGPAVGVDASPGAGPSTGVASSSNDAGAAALSVGPLFDPNPTSMVVRDDAPILYVADGAVPLIHVIDVSNPAAPVEVSSFVATSQVQPSRPVLVGTIALSPPTSQFDPVTGRAIRYLYAIDTNDGTLMVFDATNPIPTPFSAPLERPHPELDPFAPIDRLAFAAPVAAVTFVHHDWPLFPPNPPTSSNAIVGYSGLVCNPNPNTRTSTGTITTPANYGAYYAVDQAAVIEPQGAGTEGFPDRLRGVFGFVTLSNGTLVAIDVDDLDAPCRRPDPMDDAHQLGVLDLPQQAATGPGDIDPYHAPVAHGSDVAYTTQETFFPVSAPNRMRSGFLLRNDPTSGDHEPNVVGAPQLLSAAGAPVSGSGSTQPIILPTALPNGFVDPAYYANALDPNDNYGSISSVLESPDGEVIPADAGSFAFPSPTTSASVRVSLDDPTAHIDQDWVVTYEGALPTVSPIVANVNSTDNYESLTLTVGGPAPDGGGNAANAQFCALGIEDWSQGQARATAALNAMASVGLPVPVLDPSVQLPRWTSDYIEIVDDLVPQGDPYWNTGVTSPDGGPGYDCWEGTGVEGAAQANDRYNLCAQTYGEFGANADSNLARDFPIAEAYDGSLIIGRFGFPGGAVEQTSNRTVVGPDPSNVLFLKPAACCFHHQVNFKVRTGGEWVTVGQNGLGLLHHITADPSTGRCVPSVAPHDQLLNARAFDLPFFDPITCAPISTSTVAALDRTSPLAMRNPMFSFLMWAGCGTLSENQHTISARDLNWRFGLRGGFQPLTISLAGGTNLPIVPQSMAFASAFEQLAIIDGSYQGLILIDLNSLAFAHAPYF